MRGSPVVLAGILALFTLSNVFICTVLLVLYM